MKSTSCWTKDQPTSFQSAKGRPITVSASSSTPSVASSCAPTTRQKRSRTPRSAGEEADLAVAQRFAGDDDRDRRDQRLGDRADELFEQVGPGEVDAGAAGVAAGSEISTASALVAPISTSAASATGKSTFQWRP